MTSTKKIIFAIQIFTFNLHFYRNLDVILIFLIFSFIESFYNCLSFLIHQI